MSASGALWHQISNTLEEVAREQHVNPTALKEFISSSEILEMGSEFVHAYNDKHLTREKSFWVAQDLFFELQTVKHGDRSASRWTKARADKRKEWDLMDHLTRFVLCADAFRKRVDRESWDWGANFESNVCFYLGILQCFTVRDATQRQAAREARERDRDRDRDSVRLAKRASRASSSKLSRHSSKGG